MQQQTLDPTTIILCSSYLYFKYLCLLQLSQWQSIRNLPHFKHDITLIGKTIMLVRTPIYFTIGSQSDTKVQSFNVLVSTFSHKITHAHILMAFKRGVLTECKNYHSPFFI